MDKALKKIEQLEEENRKQQEAIEKLKFELKKVPSDGDWCYIENQVCNELIFKDTSVCRIKTFDKETKYFTIYNDDRNDCSGWKLDEGESFRKATRTEIEEHLIKEAERRGFKKGVKFNSPSGPEYDITGKFYYSPGVDCLNHGGYGAVYATGEWGKIVEELKEQEFKKGDWIIGLTVYPPYGPRLVLGMDDDAIDNGVKYSDEMDGVANNGNYSKNIRLATEEEIKEYLIKEAEKRGFHRDVMIEKTGINSKFTSLDGKIGEDHSYRMYNDTLDSGNGEGHIYSQGKWAEIIKNEIKVKIDTEEFEVIRDGKDFKIGCISFSLEQLQGINNWEGTNKKGKKTIKEIFELL